MTLTLTHRTFRTLLVGGASLAILAGCGGSENTAPEAAAPQAAAPEKVSASVGAAGAPAPAEASTAAPEPAAAETAPVATLSPIATPSIWPKMEPLPLDPEVEARVDEILSKLTLEQKVGQIIQADTNSVTPEEVKQYRLGSVLSGGNSAPGQEPYADAETWLAAADAYYDASVDPDGVEVAVPIIWGIDAVHGHANLLGATVFPHNVGLGAMRNPDLIEEIARVTARELAVSGHDWTFAPTVAVPQDDRWGRAYEGYAEDPSIVASYSGRIVEGLQGKFGSDDFMGEGRMISSAKHFLGDGGTKDGQDQGDAQISEEALRDIHNAGYTTAIPAGVQTVMASFSAWNGVKMHGNKSLLTDVLKAQMGFTGFVVGDWNGHGQVEGCTNTDCPQSFNAGVDMFMAPDSWKGLYESTLAHAKSGRISEERLDEAVRRILRVKIASGVFEKGRPSERPLAGEVDILMSEEHRQVARQAVRESLVLLKNAGQTLPLDADQSVLVVGDGADSITKAAGGWTLSWQGGGYPNDMFPGGRSIYEGIREAVEAAGGTVTLDPEGTSGTQADVVIAVYGEDPYAEFRGDVEHVDFTPNNFDTEQLAVYREQGAKVVSVFLSGRPLWTNPEMNDSDAFVAAWLPGSQGGGVADLLFRTDPDFDFTGRLSFSWPRTAMQTAVNVSDDAYDPLFPVGYGLSYGDSSGETVLSEESGLAAGAGAPKGVYFAAGEPIAPLGLAIQNEGRLEMVTVRPANLAGLSISGTDYLAQEDALLLEWSEPGAAFRLAAPGGIMELTRERTGELDLAFAARVAGGGTAAMQVGVDCPKDEACLETVSMTLDGEEWAEYRVSLSCFSDAVDMVDVGVPFSLRATSPVTIGLGHVRLEENTGAGQTCGD